MKNTFVVFARAFVFAALVLGMTPLLRAADVPAYDTKAYCKDMGDAMGGSSQIELTCRQGEAAAQERVAGMNASTKAMSYCDEMARSIGGSYEILATCLQEEMTAEAQLQ